MQWLPLVERELRLAARRKSTYWIRFWAALAVIGALIVLLLAVRQASAELGQKLFVTLSVMAFAFCLLAGLRYTADCLSEEKRGGTLGFLFLTDLRGFDVVLGKLIVNSIEAFYVLMASVPVLGIPLLLGGVTGGEFGRIALLLLNTLWLSLCVGMLVSAVGREERQVLLGTLLSVAVLGFGLPGLWQAANAFSNARWLDVVLLFPSPAYAFKMARSAVFRFGTEEYWYSMGTIFFLGAFFLGLASHFLPRAFQEKSSSAPMNRRHEWMDRWRFQRGDRARRLRLGLLESQPFAWLVTRDRLPAVLGIVFVVVTLVFGVWIMSILIKKIIAYRVVSVFGPLGLHLFLKVWLASEAARRLNDDQRSGALDLILATAIDRKAIFRGQFYALSWFFALPVASLLILNVMWAIGVNEKEPAWVCIGGACILLFDAWAISWVAMRFALKGWKFHRTVLAAVGWVMLPAWVTLAVMMFVATSTSLRSSTVEAFFFWWFVFSAVYDARLAFWAKKSAERHVASFGRPGRTLGRGASDHPPSLEPARVPTP